MHYKTILLAIGILSLPQGLLALPANEVRIIIKYKHSSPLTALQAQLTNITGQPVPTIKPMAGGAYTLIFDSTSLHDSTTNLADATNIILARLRKNPDVIYAVKDRVGYFKPLPQLATNMETLILAHQAQWDEFSRPGGVMLESEPYLHDGAWAYTRGLATPPVVIAVLDTGVAAHKDLVDNLIKNEDGSMGGWNFSANNHNLDDETESYHGTHVAGTIAGYGQVITGMGEHLKILPIKIPDSAGMFYESTVINAIYWSVGGYVPGTPANPFPAKVINMSFGIDEPPGKEIDHCDEALQEALWFARKQGAVLITAAGNDNRWEHYNAPAVCNGTLKIAATGPEGLRAYYSNYGPSVTFAAPGGDLHYGKEGGILSTVRPQGGYQNSGFDFYQGTSMATPHVAGIAGLMFAAREQLITPQQVEQILYTTTHNFGPSDNVSKSCVNEKPCGHGILDAENALKATLAHFDVLFSAPTDNVQATLATTTPWIKINRLKASAQPSLPYVHQAKDGTIYAFSGAERYKLDLRAYRQCQIIGFDGVGCYR